jgi:hypothetical protein
MPPPRRVDSPAKVRRAALLRAEGLPWAAVAAKLGVTLGRVKLWPARYPQLWRRATLCAEERLLHEATAECIHTLRRQLRSDDDKTVRDAAARLIALRLAWRKTRPPRKGGPQSSPTSSLARRTVAYLEALPDADTAVVETA